MKRLTAALTTLLSLSACILDIDPDHDWLYEWDDTYDTDRPVLSSSATCSAGVAWTGDYDRQVINSPSACGMDLRDLPSFVRDATDNTNWFTYESWNGAPEVADWERDARNYGYTSDEFRVQRAPAYIENGTCSQIYQVLVDLNPTYIDDPAAVRITKVYNLDDTAGYTAELTETWEWLAYSINTDSAFQEVMCRETAQYEYEYR